LAVYVNVRKEKKWEERYNIKLNSFKSGYILLGCV